MLTKALRVPWTARRSNQSNLKEINLEYSLEGMLLKLKLQYFGHLTRRTNSLEKNVIVGKIEGNGRRRQQRNRLLDSITDLMDMSLSKLKETVKDRESWHSFRGSQIVGHNLATEQQQHWIWPQITY